MELWVWCRFFEVFGWKVTGVCPADECEPVRGLQGKEGEGGRSVKVLGFGRVGV